MKLFLVSCLSLLMPLAFAYTYLEEPYATLLYDGGYIIAHGFDAQSIQFYHYFPYPPFADFRLVFETHEDKRVEAMFFDRNKFNETTSFAIDSRKGWENNLDPKDNCLRRADKKLKGLMYGCGGRTDLRPLTDEERAEVQQYKKEQQESKKPFEVIYSESGITIKSTEIEKFYFDQLVGRYGYRTLFVNATIHKDEESHEMLVMTRPAGRTFVFENTTENKGVCGKIGLEDLFLAHCKGKMQISHRQSSE